MMGGANNGQGNLPGALTPQVTPQEPNVPREHTIIYPSSYDLDYQVQQLRSHLAHDSDLDKEAEAALPPTTELPCDDDEPGYCCCCGDVLDDTNTPGQGDIDASFQVELFQVMCRLQQVMLLFEDLYGGEGEEIEGYDEGYGAHDEDLLMAGLNEDGYRVTDDMTIEEALAHEMERMFAVLRLLEDRLYGSTDLERE